MKSTANKTRPKVMNAGMDRPHPIAMSQAVARNDYGRFVSAFQTNKSKPNPRFQLAEQARLCSSGALLRLDSRDRGHVEYAARRHPGGQDMCRTRRPDQDRSYGKRIR